MLRQQIFRFLIAGGVATALHFSIMWALITAHITAWLSTAAGAAVGAAANYLIQFHWAFASERRHQQTAPNYIVACALGWILNAAGFVLFHSTLEFAVVTAQLLTSSCLTLINFLLYRFLVFL